MHITGAAIFGRHGDAKPSGVGHRSVELTREFTVVVACEPVFVVEAAHDCIHAVANRASGSSQRKPWREEVELILISLCSFNRDPPARGR